jgi:hypothetical protein
MSQLIILHSVGGKSAFAKKYAPLAQDADSARTTALERELAPLRATRSWAEHNSLWHEALRTYKLSVSQACTLFLHSYADVLAVANAYDLILWSEPSDRVFSGYRKHLAGNDRERLALSLENRNLNRRDHPRLFVQYDLIPRAIVEYAATGYPTVARFRTGE